MNQALIKWQAFFKFLTIIQILANINLKIPEEGEKIKRLVEIAQERNIDYKPSLDAATELNSYCDRKGVPNPLHAGKQ